MNATLEMMHKRRSVRAFSGQPVTEEEKQAILQATFRAPTAGNMMLYSIIEVEDQALKDRLAVTCDHQPFIAKAPYVLLFVADYQRWFDYYTVCGVEQRCQELGKTYRTPQLGDALLAIEDTLIAAQTAVLAAESLGIGSCYIGDILENYEIHRELFALPRYTLPISLVVFGHPQPNEKALASRFDPQYVVFKNTYQRLSQEQLLEMMRPTTERQPGPYPNGALNIGQANYFRKFIAEFSLEMSRSAAEMLKNWE